MRICFSRNSGRGRSSRSRSRGLGSSPSWIQHFDHLTRIWDGISDRSSRSVTGTMPWSPQQGALISLEILALFALHETSFCTLYIFTRIISF